VFIADYVADQQRVPIILYNVIDRPALRPCVSAPPSSSAVITSPVAAFTRAVP
jgi:hypothetical protein